MPKRTVHGRKAKSMLRTSRELLAKLAAKKKNKYKERNEENARNTRLGITGMVVAPEQSPP